MFFFFFLFLIVKPLFVVLKLFPLGLGTSLPWLLINFQAVALFALCQLAHKITHSPCVRLSQKNNWNELTAINEMNNCIFGYYIHNPQWAVIEFYGQISLWLPSIWLNLLLFRYIEGIYYFTRVFLILLKLNSQKIKCRCSPEIIHLFKT